MRVRQLIVVLVLVGVGVGLLPSKAAACSCAARETAEMLAEHDAAFIGTMVGKRGGLLWGKPRWRFEVTEWIKGDLGRTVDVRTDASGAGCGFELAEGEEAAIFVSVEGTRLDGGLCSTMDADTVRAHLHPQEAVATQASLLVAGSGGNQHLWLFDGQGRLAGASADGRGRQLADFSLCPGGRVAVELWDTRRMVVRDLRTLRARRVRRMPGDLGRVWCRDAGATKVLGARRDNSTGQWRSIVDVRRPQRPVISGRWLLVEIAGDRAVVAAGRQRTGLHRVVLGTGRTTPLYRTPKRSHAVVEGFAVSPDATRVAYEVTHYPPDGQPSSEVFVTDLQTGEVLAQRRLRSEGIEIRWLNDHVLAYAAYDAGVAVLDAWDLSTSATLPSEAAWVSLQTGNGTMLGMDGPRLTAVDPTAGDGHVLATVAAGSSRVLRLPRRLSLKGPATAAAQPGPRPLEAAPQDRPPAVGSGTAVPLGAAAAVLLAGAALLVLRRRASR